MADIQIYGKFKSASGGKLVDYGAVDNAPEVVQATGSSTTAVMSQKAVSDALSAITPAKIGAATPSYVDSAITAALGEAESALAEV